MPIAEAIGFDLPQKRDAIATAAREEMAAMDTEGGGGS